MVGNSVRPVGGRVSGEINWILATVTPVGVIASAEEWTRWGLETEA